MSLETPAQDALALLLGPLAPEQFFAEFYERKFYRNANKSDQAAALLSLDRVDEILSDSELPASSISMAKSGRSIPETEITFPNGVVDRGSVLDNFRDGCTLILPQMHLADGNLYNFCLALERQFGARTQTNVYLTPPGETGFGVHYDDHDVFVIQISGAKEWEIYGDRDGLPYKGESFRKDHDDTGELKETFVLNPGECLYVPRGTAHRAPNHGDEPSLHITVGILVQTWAEFMLEAVAEASLRVPEMRHSLPRDMFFEGGDVRARHAQTFRGLIDELAAKASFEATLGAFSGNFVSGQGPRLRGALLSLAQGIGPDDRLTIREHILFNFEPVPDADGDSDVDQEIVLSGGRIPMSGALAEQLQQRIAAGSMRKSDFSVTDAEELDDVIGSLVAYGLLLRADSRG